MTFEFLTLRCGERCIQAVEFVAGENRLIDELPVDTERDALRAWLMARGLSEIASR